MDLRRALAMVGKAMRLLRRPVFAATALREGVAASVEHLEAIDLCQARTLIDIGANKGQFSLAFRVRRPNSVIVAFEPLPEAADRFDRLFGADRAVELHRVALSDAEGEAQFHVTNRADSSSLLKPGAGLDAAFAVHGTSRIQVPVRRLDQCVPLAGLARPILVKIDVQGAELDVLRGCDDLTAVDYIYVELSYVELYEGQPRVDEIVAYLDARGFHLSGVYNQVTTAHFGPTQADFLFTNQGGPGPDSPVRSDGGHPADPKPLICFVGPCPPPVHGQSIATKNMLDLLRARNFPVEVAGVGTGRGPRVLREIAAAWNIVRSPAPDMYLVVNGNLGLLYTVLHAAMARLSGKRLSLHHHSFRYIGRHDWLMGTLALVAGRSATHITNCPAMSRQLSARYPRIAKTLGFSNVGSVPVELRPTGRPGAGFVLGHLSNLTEEKGIGRVVDAFRHALAAGKDVRLVIAGPTADEFSERALAGARAEFGDRFTYFGPVFGEQKLAFFRAIDLFLFPSRYPTETQGIVNLEALAAGKPVIAFDQCCIGEDIGSDGGKAVATDEDYAQAFLDYLDLFASDPGGASARARARFETLLREHEADVERLVAHLRLPPA